MFLERPVTFSEARDWLRRRVSVPTNLGSLEIAAAVPAEVRNQAFFSARVASASILQKLRENVAEIAAGELGYAEARTRMKEILALEGYEIAAPGEADDRDVKKIQSSARLDLIFRQNVAMAHSRGQREVSEHPAVVELFPNYRYIANTDRHEAFDGIVLPKSDPFWQTHYPPIDFNCECFVIDEPGEPNARTGQWTEDGQSGVVEHRGQLLPVLPNESGYEFRSAPGEAPEMDLGRIEDVGWREQVRAELEARGAL